MMNIKTHILDAFGKAFMRFVRDQTIETQFQVMRGEIRGKIAQSLAEKLKEITPANIEIVKDLVIDTVDSALNNFMWFIEQSDEFDVVCQKDREAHSLNKLSDGLSVDYWNFVDDFSKFKRLDK